MLINVTQIKKYKAITSNADLTKLDNFIQEAQDFDLCAFLGNELYFDLLDDFNASPSLVKYANLYNGCQYTYAGRTYTHPGLVPVLSYYTYARYVAGINVVSTKFGLVNKTNDFSNPISDKTTVRLIEQAKSGAILYQEQVKRYLDINYVTYPLWRFGLKRKKGSVTISSVGGNSNDRKYCNMCRRYYYNSYCGCGFGIEPEIIIS